MRNAATPAPPPGRANVEAGAAARDDSRNSAPRDEAPSTKRHGPQRGIAGGGREAAELASAAAESKDERESRRARRPARRAAASRDESAKQQSVPEEDREQQQGETRSAGGRRFRSVRGVWIDTAYKPQQATIVVRVNSEQYRALVADEPEIGRISRALGGEVVIVWKGRAYRVKP
jgi:hypothetical protein